MVMGNEVEGEVKNGDMSFEEEGFMVGLGFVK